jgi:hypothetical protein
VRSESPAEEILMKPTISKTGGKGPTAFAPPTPKVSRQKRAKVLTATERAAFLASRPDLKKPE